MIVHLSQTFISLRMYLTLISSTIRVDKLLALLLRPAIFFDLAFLAEIEWGSSQIDVPFLYQAAHTTEEEGQNQRGNMASIDIGIGHDDDLLIAQLA